MFWVCVCEWHVWEDIEILLKLCHQLVKKNWGICDSDKLAAEEAAAKKAAEEKAARDLGLFLSHIHRRIFLQVIVSAVFVICYFTAPVLWLR